MSGVAAIVLAAGASRRMGGEDKLTKLAGGVPLLHRVTGAALASRASVVLAVLGANRETREAVLPAGVRRIVNEHWPTGMASSIRAGIESLDPRISGVLIILGDMPEVDAPVLDALIGAFGRDTDIIRPRAASGPIGNPILFGRRHFPALTALSGDSGAKSVIAANPGCVRDVPVGDGVLIDLDTPEAWDRWQGGTNG